MKRTLSGLCRRYLVVGGGVLAISGLIFWLWWQQSPQQPTNPQPETTTKPVGEIDYSPPANTPQTTQPITDQSPPSSTPNSDSTDPPTAEANPIRLSISQSGGSPLQIRVLITELLTDGRCQLRLTKPGSTAIEQSVDLFTAPHYTTCQGFSVPDQQLSSSAWTATVTVQSGQRTGQVRTTINRP